MERKASKKFRERKGANLDDDKIERENPSTKSKSGERRRPPAEYILGHAPVTCYLEGCGATTAEGDGWTCCNQFPREM